MRTFASDPRADVTMIGRRFSALSRGAAADAFLRTAARLWQSSLCLVPLGITATSRRLYEALSAGCISSTSPATCGYAKDHAKDHRRGAVAAG